MYAIMPMRINRPRDTCSRWTVVCEFLSTNAHMLSRFTSAVENNFNSYPSNFLSLYLHQLGNELVECAHIFFMVESQLTGERTKLVGQCLCVHSFGKRSRAKERMNSLTYSTLIPAVERITAKFVGFIY
jgi:hypothetical protein